MNTIKKHLKEKIFVNSYLLFGEEQYLVRQYKTKLADAICNGDDMNLSFYEGKAINLNEIRDVSLTLPFFSDKRLIIIENSGMFKSASEGMVDILKNSPESTTFIFVENEVDKRNRLYKLINEKGYACEFKTPTDEDLTKWVFKYFKDAGKQITHNDMNLFMQIAGSDMDNIYNEAMKLIAYCLKKEVITADDICAICSTRTVDRVFDMIQAMATGNTDEVMRLYGDLLALKEPPMKILALIGGQFSKLFSVRKMMDEGSSGRVIADKLQIRSYFINKYINQAKSYTIQQLKDALTDCVETENLIKTGKTDEKYAVEMLIIKYSIRMTD